MIALHVAEVAECSEDVGLLARLDAFGDDVEPRVFANAPIVASIARASSSLVISAISMRSILITDSGMRRSIVSEEYPLPKSSI